MEENKIIKVRRFKMEIYERLQLTTQHACSTDLSDSGASVKEKCKPVIEKTIFKNKLWLNNQYLKIIYHLTPANVEISLCGICHKMKIPKLTAASSKTIASIYAIPMRNPPKVSFCSALLMPTRLSNGQTTESYSKIVTMVKSPKLIE